MNLQNQNHMIWHLFKCQSDAWYVGVGNRYLIVFKGITFSSYQTHWLGLSFKKIFNVAVRAKLTVKLFVVGERLHDNFKW